jgi:mannosyltransferase
MKHVITIETRPQSATEATIHQQEDTIQHLPEWPKHRSGRPGMGRMRLLASSLIPAAAALALGLWGLRRQDSMWRDESVTYQVAHRSLPDLWGLLGNVDAVHGLYYLLMHGVFALWDGGLDALRLPSVLATAVAAAGIGATGRRLAGVRVGVLSGLAFALLPMVQQYAQEGRSYALVCAAVIWATYVLLRGVEWGGPWTWMVYAALVTVACWLHEFAALVLVAHAVTLWWCGVARPTVWRWARASASAMATVLPLAMVSAGQSERQLGWLGRPSGSAWLMFGMLSCAGGLLAWALRRRPAPDPAAASVDLVRLALPLLVVPTGLLMTTSLIKPWYVDRYVLYGMAGLALLVGAALGRMWAGHSLRWPEGTQVPRPVVVCAVTLGAVAVLLPWSLEVRSPDSRKDDVIAVIDTVLNQGTAADGVLFMPARRREWLLSSPGVYGRLPDLALKQTPAASRTLEGTELPAATIRDRILAVDRIIALTDPPGQPLDQFAQEEVKRETLRNYFERCGTTPLHGAQVVVYARPGHCG